MIEASETNRPERTAVRENGPDFVGVGCHKSGSTWLSYVLEQHPDVFIGKKELAYFTQYWRKGYRWYERQFADKSGRFGGEITPDYLITPRDDPHHKEFYPNWNPRNTLMVWRKPLPSARDEFAARYPGLRVFAIFRNPIDRVWSHYWFWRGRRERNGKSVVPFEQMFRDDGRWMRTHGYYARHLKHWRERFPGIGVFFYDDLVERPGELAREVYKFLGVDDAFTPAISKRVNPTDYEPMPAPARALAAATYAEDIHAFEEMTGRDLAHWLRESQA